MDKRLNDSKNEYYTKEIETKEEYNSIFNNLKERLLNFAKIIKWCLL